MDTSLEASSNSPERQTAAVAETPIPFPNTNLDDNKKSCWVCFATEDDEVGYEWVKPCKCRGTTKWVHQVCLQRWVDEKQKGNAFSKVHCPQCNTEYVIVFPTMGPIVILIDTLDTIVYKVCPFLAAGILVGSIYWTAVTYGAITIMQVVGHDEGLALMAGAQSLVLLIGLPSIPMMLIFGKMVRWEETVLLFLRRYSPKVPVLKYILPSFVYHEDLEQQRSNNLPSFVDTICATKVLCSALLLPTIATIIGGVLFESVTSKVQRTLLGGITFVAIKGLFRMYHKQQKYVQKSKRFILDYVPVKNPAADSSSAASTNNNSTNNSVDTAQNINPNNAPIFIPSDANILRHHSTVSSTQTSP